MSEDEASSNNHIKRLASLSRLKKISSLNMDSGLTVKESQQLPSPK